jgi:predicted site-specific integrase-resolvase
MATVITGGIAPGDVIPATAAAAILGIAVKTVIRREAAGRLPVFLRTPGGDRRWHRAQVTAVRDGLPVPVIIPELPELMTAGEVAAAFGAHMESVRRWAAAGLLATPLRTPGGHARHRGADVAAVMRGEKPEGAAGAG